ncbi:MAG: hypothetical protein EXQ52_04285 [Bryobacterales bacterium]|nr:hypothetical protein [Bryobacterales bacterium]
MALIGYEREKEKIDSKIAEIRAMLGGTKAAARSDQKGSAAPARKKRVLSEAARKRISTAQKKRWAEHKRSKGETGS